MWISSIHAGGEWTPLSWRHVDGSIGGSYISVSYCGYDKCIVLYVKEVKNTLQNANFIDKRSLKIKKVFGSFSPASGSEGFIEI